jgi:hypothetical protein
MPVEVTAVQLEEPSGSAAALFAGDTTLSGDTSSYQASCLECPAHVVTQDCGKHFRVAHSAAPVHLLVVSGHFGELDWLRLPVLGRQQLPSGGDSLVSIRARGRTVQDNFYGDGTGGGCAVGRERSRDYDIEIR